MLIDGKKTSMIIRESVRAEVSGLIEKNKIPPKLAVILVGDSEASKIYVRNKEKACKDAMILTQTIRENDKITEEELIKIVKSLNDDDTVHGILVQLPLPKHINDTAVIDAIDPEKDVDGFHTINKGAMLLSNKGLLPATPKGILTLLKMEGVSIAGAKVVVVGRSNIVGKPAAIMLLNENATVTITNSHTRDLKSETLQADILIVAAGKARLITADMVKPGAVVIDVGVNRVDDKICGDVDFENVEKVASMITPVPGGVGPMTIASLLENTVVCYKKKMRLS